MRVTRIIAAAALALASTFAVAATSETNNGAEQAIRKSLQTLELEVPIESVASSPLNGLYEVKLQGGRVLYASADGQFVMQGYLFQIADGKPVNLTEKTERQGIAKLINGIPAAEMVVYPAKGETKSHITVFTDTTCPYCHKLHAEVPELNRRGIEVRYVAFPRQGLGSTGDERGDGQDGRWQGRQSGQVRQPGGQTVPVGPVDRCQRYASHRARKRAGDSWLPASPASGQAGPGCRQQVIQFSAPSPCGGGSFHGRPSAGRSMGSSQ